MLIPFKWPVMPRLQGARVIYCCLKRKWCWKGNSIFTTNRDFQRVGWTFYFSIIFNWIAPEHYIKLQLKNHNSSHLYKFNFLCAVYQIFARWAKLSVGTSQFFSQFFSLIFPANRDIPFNSSITICEISGTSSWLLKLKGDPRSLVILFLKAQRKLDGSVGLVLCFKRDIFRFTAVDKGKILSCLEDSWE